MSIRNARFCLTLRFVHFEPFITSGISKACEISTKIARGQNELSETGAYSAPNIK